MVIWNVDSVVINVGIIKVCQETDRPNIFAREPCYPYVRHNELLFFEDRDLDTVLDHYVAMEKMSLLSADIPINSHGEFDA
ncbi:MAG: hypothetical protein ACJAUP_002568 [Cellvibrionaceae bacterium]